MKTADSDLYTVHSEYMFLAGGWDRSSFEAREKALSFCKATGLQMDIVDEKRGGVPGFTPLSTDLNFKCTGSTSVLITPTQGTPLIPLSFDQAKDKCIELGFKAVTDSYGQCVLKLVK